MNEGLADDEIKQLKFWKDFGNFCWPQLCCFVRNKRSIEAKALNVRLFKGRNETVWGYFLKLKVIRFVETFSDLWRESFEPSELYVTTRTVEQSMHSAEQIRTNYVKLIPLIWNLPFTWAQLKVKISSFPSSASKCQEFSVPNEKPLKCGQSPLLDLSYRVNNKGNQTTGCETAVLTCRSRRRSLKWLPQPRPCSQPPEL